MVATAAGSATLALPRFALPSDPAPLRVRRLLGRDRVVAEDGAVFRLRGLWLPNPARPDEATFRRALQDRLRNGPFRVRKPFVDRYGERAGQLIGPDGEWLQGRLLRDGLAQARYLPEQADQHAAMAASEAVAREAERGLWRLSRYRPLSPEMAAPAAFAIWRGRVRAVARQRRYVYVNFGEDWRTDASLRVPKEALPRGRSGFDPEAWADRVVEARGAVAAVNGPMMEITHPAQVRVLPA